MSTRQMGRLCCNCLNVTVHHSSSAETGRRVPATRLLPEGCKDRIVDKEVAEIELDVAGVTIVSPRIKYFAVVLFSVVCNVHFICNNFLAVP